MLNFLKDRTALSVIIAGLLIRLIPGTVIPPGFDEAYYGVYSFNLSMGYFDHPPMVALTAGIGSWLTGLYSPLTLRLGAIILFLLTSGLVYDLTGSIFGRRAGIISLFFLHVIPYFLVGLGAFVIPDNALGFFSLLFVWSLYKQKTTENLNYLYLSGIALGFALLSKYHAVLLILGLSLSIIMFKEWRTLLLRKEFYFMLLIAVIIFLPNIIWNYQHEWVSYRFQFGKGAGNIDLSMNSFLQGVFVQAGYLLPWNMIVLLMGAFKIRKFKGTADWLIPFAALPIIIFTLVGATRQILPHWPMPGYLFAIILASGWLQSWSDKSLKIFFSVSGVLTGIALIVITLQSLTGFIPLEKKADLTLDGQGWSEVLMELEKDGILNNEDNFLFTHKWFNSGELAYAGEGLNRVTVFNDAAPHGFVFWVENSELLGNNGIFVCSDRYEANPSEFCADYFEDIQFYKSVTTYRAGKEAQVFKIWYCRNLLKEFPNPYESR